MKNPKDSKARRGIYIFWTKEKKLVVGTAEGSKIIHKKMKINTVWQTTVYWAI